MTVGTYIMGRAAAVSSSTVTVYRGSTILSAGALYAAGEQLRVGSILNNFANT
jgi:hypothetical protein